MKKVILLLVFALSFMSVGSAALVDNVVAWYPMDDTTSPFNSLDDWSENDYDLSNNGSTYINNSEGYEFEGGGTDTMNVPFDSSLLGSSFAIFSWVKGDDAPTNNEGIVDAEINGNTAFSLLRTSSHDCRGTMTDSSSTRIHLYGSGTSNGNWYHCGMTYDGVCARLYQDGVLQETNCSVTGNLRDNGVNFILGRGQWDSSANRYFDGRISDVAFWSQNLTSSEITDLFNYGREYGPNFEINISFDAINCTSCENQVAEPYTTSDTTPTFSLIVSDDSSCRIGAINQSYAAMGGSRNCSGQGSANHVCTLGTQDELYQANSELYVVCESGLSNISERLVMNITNLSTNVSNKILLGIQSSSIWPDAVVYTDQQVFLRNLENDQFVGTVDYVATYGDQRWIFNYEEDNKIGLFNISPAVYVLDLVNVTVGSVASTVETFIDSTKR